MYLYKSKQEAFGNYLQVGGSTAQEVVYASSAGEELARLRAALSAAGDVAFEWDLTADSIKWSGDVEKAFGITDGQIPETAAAFESVVA